jgi:hypothetical protein
VYIVYIVHIVYIVYIVYIVHIVHMWKSDKFTAYPHETKGPVYVVHFSRKYFASRRTSLAKGRMHRRQHSFGREEVGEALACVSDL